MADRLISDDVLDAALSYIANNCARQVLLSSGVDAYSEVATYTLAAATMTSGDFSNSAGLVSGRRMTVAAKSSVSITATGTATHIALVDDTNSDILLLVPMPALSLTSGGTTNIASWQHEQRAPQAGL